MNRSAPVFGVPVIDEMLPKPGGLPVTFSIWLTLPTCG
jgi:hypothetical protein